MKTKRFHTAALILALVFAQATTTFAQSVGINDDGSEPDSRAILDVKSTSKGVILPRLSDTERDALYQDVPQGMIIYNTTDQQLQVFINNKWFPLSMGTYEDAPFEFNDVTNPTTGTIWMDRNLGASQAATSSTDSDSYGDLYQWGREDDGHEKRTSSTTSTLSSSDTPGHSDFITNGSSPYDWRSTQNDNLWQGASGINNPCPSGYRLPTQAEWLAELDTWSSNNAAGAYASPLKLPVAGRRSGSDGSLGLVGSYGYYWSCTVDVSYSRHLRFSGSYAGMLSSYRATGYSVRCLKDN